MDAILVGEPGSEYGARMGKDEASEEAGSFRYQLAGWILFVVCAFLFIASSWRNGDTLALLGSLIFLLGCVVFLVPLVGAAIRTRGRAGQASASAPDQVAEPESERDQ